jgi:RNA polymerase sigma-70 factor (sigma-E family)
VSSFESFLAERGEDVMRLAFVLCPTRADAEDVVQDVLTRALERWDTVGAADDVYGYVRRMVVNANVSRWRRTRRREVLVAELPDRGVGEDHADSHALWQACQQLPSRQRNAVVLRFYEGLSYAEIGGILKTTEATARSHVFHGLRRLRERFGEEVE